MLPKPEKATPPPPPSRPLWTPLPTPRWLGLELKGPPPPGGVNITPLL